MKRKSLSQVFHEVDPDLTVIPGGSYCHSKRRKAVRLSGFSKPETPYYRPHEINIDDWEKAGGPNCPECGQAVMQLVNGVCVQCFRQKEASREEAFEVKTMRNYYRRKLREGTISLRAMREGYLGDNG